MGNYISCTVILPTLSVNTGDSMTVMSLSASPQHKTSAKSC